MFESFCSRNLFDDESKGNEEIRYQSLLTANKKVFWQRWFYCAGLKGQLLRFDSLRHHIIFQGHSKYTAMRALIKK